MVCHTLHPLHVAVVDADPLYCSVLARQLEEQSGGFLSVIIRAGNGAELLVALEGRLPDVVLMDPMVPVMDGRTTVGYLKALFPEILVAAFLPAGEDIDHERWSLRSGFDIRLRKSDDLFAIISRIRRAAIGTESGSGRSEQVLFRDYSRMSAPR